MPAKISQTLGAENLLIGPKLLQPGALASSVLGAGLPKLIEQRPALLRCERVRLVNEPIDVLAANDYASQELVLLPNRDLMFLWAKLSCGNGNDTSPAVVLIGFTSNAGSALDVSIGTAAASSATLNGTMANVLQKVDGVDVSSGVGNVFGVTDAATSGLVVPAAAGGKLYLNVADACTATATMSFLGAFIDLCYLDFGPTLP